MEVGGGEARSRGSGSERGREGAREKSGYERDAQSEESSAGSDVVCKVNALKCSFI